MNRVECKRVQCNSGYGIKSFDRVDRKHRKVNGMIFEMLSGTFRVGEYFSAPKEIIYHSRPRFLTVKFCYKIITRTRKIRIILLRFL